MPTTMRPVSSFEELEDMKNKAELPWWIVVSAPVGMRIHLAPGSALCELFEGTKAKERANARALELANQDREVRLLNAKGFASWGEDSGGVFNQDGKGKDAYDKGVKTVV